MLSHIALQNIIFKAVYCGTVFEKQSTQNEQVMIENLIGVKWKALWSASKYVH